MSARRHRSGGLLLVIGLLLAAGTGCGRRPTPRAQEGRTRALEQLRQDLWRFDFAGVSREALLEAERLAARSHGPAAADLWNQVATSRLDWTLLALLWPDTALLPALLRHVGLPASCARGQDLAPRCLASLATRVGEGFTRAAALHRTAGDTAEAERAERRARLARLALVHRAFDEALHGPLEAALGDPSYDLRRWAQLLFMARLLQTLGAAPPRGPLTATAALLQAVPLPCPAAFRAVDRLTPEALERALAACNCTPACQPTGAAQGPDPRAAPPSTRLPARRAWGTPAGAQPQTPANAPRCAISADAFGPLPSALLTQRGAMAVRSLRALLRVAAGVRAQRDQGLLRRLRPLVERTLTTVQSLRVPVPLPPELRLGARTVRPPVMTVPLPVAWESRASVLLVVAGDRAQLGLAPQLTPSGDELLLLPPSEDRFPGTAALVSPTRFALGQALRQAHQAAQRHLGRDGIPRGVGLYADGQLSMAELVRWLRRLQEAGVVTVELLYGDGHGTARALTLRWSGRGTPAATPWRPTERYGDWLRARLQLAAQGDGARATAPLDPGSNAP